MNPAIVEAIEQVEEAKKNLKTVIRAYCVDKSQPVWDRWGAFVKSDIGEHSGWIESFDSVDDDLFCCCSAPMYFERYQVIKMTRIVENYDEDDKDWTKYMPNVEAFVEECMERNIKSFELDW